MSLIYIPSGKAREYSPLALNIYNGCDHDCKYCYVKIQTARSPRDNLNPSPKANLLEILRNELIKFKSMDQVLLCFTGDPYCHADVHYKTTREVLKLLLKYQVPVAILSKGGKRILRDIDLFQQFDNIKVGATLTFDNPDDSFEIEPGAALPADRINTLKILSQHNIKTWVSFEPVIETSQTFRLFHDTRSFVNEYKIGKLNHYPQSEYPIDWNLFGEAMYKLLLKYKKSFYIKKDLYEYFDTKIDSKYTDMNQLTLKSIQKKEYKQMSLIDSS